MSQIPFKAIQDTVDSLQKVIWLERELFQARAQRVLRRRMGRSIAAVLAAFLIFEALTLALFWASIRLFQVGFSVGGVIALTAGPLALLAVVLLLWSGRRSGRRSNLGRGSREESRFSQRTAA